VKPFAHSDRAVLLPALGVTFTDAAIAAQSRAFHRLRIDLPGGLVRWRGSRKSVAAARE